jgi:cysteine desulfurase family protein
MPVPDRIYLDNAATSWPKPEAVYSAVDHYMRELGAPAGRSAYHHAGEVERRVNEARQRVATLLGAPQAKQIIFTSNGTDSLNLALHGLLREGQHVVTSECEHNSVLRPLRELEETRGVRVTRVPCNGAGLIDPDDVASAAEFPNTKLIALVHASNVTGALQPLEEVGQMALRYNIRFLVDASQSVGHLPVSVMDLAADMLAAPGHKGLLGPLGTGILYIAPGTDMRLLPVRQGGTGTQSESDQQPKAMPDKFESGNHNVPGIVGLNAGVNYLAERGLDEIRQHEKELTAKLLDGFRSIKGVTIYGPGNADQQLGVVSISIAGYDPQEVATMLDSTYSIQVRSGLHCAPLMHQSLGTASSGGTIRFSLGPFNTAAQIDATVEAIGEIATSAV